MSSRSRALVSAGLIVVGISIAGAPSTRAATPPAPATIDVSIVAPPSVEPTLTTVVLLDGVDVTAEQCTSGTTDDDRAHPIVTCPDVPDGNYDVVVTSSDPDVRIDIACSDLASPVGPPFVIDDGYRQTTCDVIASTPGVLLGVDAPSSMEPIPPPPPVRLRDPDGVDVTASCELDNVNDADRRWCTDLTEGTYTAEIDVPVGYGSRVVCAPMTLSLVDDPTFGALATVSADEWLWSCVPLDPYPPLTIVVGYGLNADAPSWFDDIDYEVTGSGGDATGSCSVVRVEPGPVPPPHLEIHCPGLPDGSYDVAVTGIPDDLELEQSCDTVEVVDGGPTTCQFSAVPSAPSTTTLAPTTTLTPISSLPSTGARAARTGSELALVMLFVGGTLVLVGRRRPSAT